MIEDYLVGIAFAALSAFTAVLVFQVRHLNDVIRDLRFDLQDAEQDAEDECNRLEDRLKVIEALLSRGQNVPR